MSDIHPSNKSQKGSYFAQPPFLLAALLLAVVSWVLSSRYLISHRGIIPGDFQVYLRAWERVKAGGTPYLSADSSPFKYSPGALALIGLLPAEPEAAWHAYGWMSIAAFVLPLLFAVRYRCFRSVSFLALGLVLAWKGILETLDYGQAELLLFGLASIASSTFETLPVVSGFCLGLLPGFKLPWFFLFLPFLMAARTESRKREHHFRRFLTGYLGAWFFWAAALPSLVFGADHTQLLSEEWLRLLHTQPSGLFYSDINQGWWVSCLRLFPSLPPMAVLGGAAVVAGLVLGRLVARLNQAAESRILPRDSLAWITPWLLFNQWINPLAWRWGSVLAVGAPLSWDRRPGRHTRGGWWISGIAIGALWLLQQTPFLKIFGVQHWTVLHPYGVVSFYWALLIWIG